MARQPLMIPEISSEELAIEVVEELPETGMTDEEIEEVVEEIVAVDPTPNFARFHRFGD